MPGTGDRVSMTEMIHECRSGSVQTARSGQGAAQEGFQEEGASGQEMANRALIHCSFLVLDGLETPTYSCGSPLLGPLQNILGIP